MTTHEPLSSLLSGCKSGCKRLEPAMLRALMLAAAVHAACSEGVAFQRASIGPVDAARHGTACARARLSLAWCSLPLQCSVLMAAAASAACSTASIMTGGNTGAMGERLQQSRF